MKKSITLFSLFLFLFFSYSTTILGQDSGDSRYQVNLGALSFRSIGPAVTSGRIADFAVNPDDHSEFYVATASGGVWKTTNGGTNFDPVFENQGSYSIGTVTMDPNNHNVVWVGTGENNNQRSVSYGDGIYKTEDGGQSWKNLGLKNSEHIGMIAVDPRNSNVVYVAAYGPLWSSGGDRGLYKTTDGGQTWQSVLSISENTGISEVHLDPRNPDVIYAVAHQRRRTVFTLVDGGPESAVYKSNDGGENWHKIMNGLPGGWIGRIGLAISPANPDVLYAIVEAQNDKGGFYRSTDRGKSWQRRSDYTSRGNYYQELVPDPKDIDRVYSMDTYGKVTDDGGKTWHNTGERNKHVDNHALWIDPDNTAHMLNGNDGGVYETFDRGDHWRFFPNLPVTQFYKVAVDYDKPFYGVYGGTQDNFSLGGPSRTISPNGIANKDWFVTRGGDGFESAVDPENSNIVYAESQYGGLVRFDKQSGESVSIQPEARKDENGYTWNWNAPLLISPHNHTTLYFAADKIFKSTDRGDSWQVISPDLTRGIDRNKLKVMGHVWPMDAVAKNASTSKYGNIVALDESPVKQGLLYAGTDDGLIQISKDDGQHWRKVSGFPGVPDRTYVSDIIASHTDANTVYASFDNHKNGDFKPYVLKSTDAGKSWKPITNNLPEKGTVYSLEEDYKNPNLLFAGTEYGFFFSVNGGEQWKQIKKGLPTIAVRDIALQKREDDVAIATFGRGFYILDNYSLLRSLSEDILNEQAHIFPAKDAKMFVQYSRIGGRDKGFHGETYFTAPNPPVGAKIDYYLKESIKTKEQKRQQEESKKFKNGEPVYYPNYKERKSEQDEQKPFLLFTILDADSNIVREIRKPASAGVHELNWDFHYPDMTSANKNQAGELREPNSGIMVMPGTYQVMMSKNVDGEITTLAGPVSFNVVRVNNRTLPPADKAARVKFQEKVADISKALNAAQRTLGNLNDQVAYFKSALKSVNGSTSDIMKDIRAFENKVQSLQTDLRGDRVKRELDMDQPPSIASRIFGISYNFNSYTGAPTQAMRDQYQIAAEKFGPVYNRLKRLVNTDLPNLQNKMDKVGAPWTPGRLPDWSSQ